MFLPNKEVLDAAQTIKKCICMTSVMTQASQAPHTIKEPPQPQDREQSWAVAKTFVRVPVFSNPTLSYLYIYIHVYIYTYIYISLSLSLGWAHAIFLHVGVIHPARMFFRQGMHVQQTSRTGKPCKAAWWCHRCLWKLPVSVGLGWTLDQQLQLDSFGFIQFKDRETNKANKVKETTLG